ncbi:MAG: glycosyltransferase family 2 protein [Thermodesulfovibrionales bacterium]|nr:glycosyltransferase family 2 protein [Thermodesulfovibrionales bacterium]
MNNNSLSVAIIAKDSEKDIERCLKSLEFADEIVVVVDSRTTDSTVSIAQSFGCRVFIEDWKGHDGQKNSAVEKCSNLWVLSIDADERIPETTRDKILQVLSSPRFNVYRFPRKNHIQGRWLKRGDFWPDWQIRLFKKTSGKFIGNPHDKWVCSDEIGTIEEPIEHFSFRDYHDMIQRMNVYSTVCASDFQKKGFKTNSLTPIIHGLSMFIKIYFIKMGFLDGIDGLVNAVIKANGSFFKYAKLIEMKRQDTSPKK